MPEVEYMLCDESFVVVFSPSFKHCSGSGAFCASENNRSWDLSLETSFAFEGSGKGNGSDTLT